MNPNGIPVYITELDPGFDDEMRIYTTEQVVNQPNGVALTHSELAALRKEAAREGFEAGQKKHLVVAGNAAFKDLQNKDFESYWKSVEGEG